MKSFFYAVICSFVFSACANSPSYYQKQSTLFREERPSPSPTLSQYWKNELKPYRLLDLEAGSQKVRQASFKHLSPYPCAVIIDPGHGGEDVGSIGHGGIKEKELVLSISRLATDVLKKSLSCQIVMTRGRDRRLSLQTRAALANRYVNAVFVSIHANAHPNTQFNGMEIYYFSPTSDEESLSIAMRENALGREDLGEVNWILRDLEMRARAEFGKELALVLNESLRPLAAMTAIKSRGIKGAPFFVLAESQVPSVLIEVGFLTHPAEASRLLDPSFHELFAKALAYGLGEYFERKEYSPQIAGK